MSPDEARRQCFKLVRVLGELVWAVRNIADDFPVLAHADPVFAVIATSLSHARGDAIEDANAFAQRVCAALGAVFAGIVTLDEIDQEAKADFRRRFGDS